MKTYLIKIEGVRVYWNGSSVEYLLPSGFSGIDLFAFAETHKKEINQFIRQCTR